MALRIRRGTDAERQTVVFAEGELVYTTDTKELYIGDGATFGGILVSQTEDTPTPPGGITSIVEDTLPQLGGNLDLNNREIFGVGDIDITGTVTADVINSGLFVGDGSGLTNIGAGIVEGSNYRINIVGDDSTLLINGSNNSASINTFLNVASIEKISGNLGINIQSIADEDISLAINTIYSTNIENRSTGVISFVYSDPLEQNVLSSFISSSPNRIFITCDPNGTNHGYTKGLRILKEGNIVSAGPFDANEGININAGNLTISDGSLFFDTTKDVLDFPDPIKGQTTFDETSFHISFWDGRDWFKLLRTNYLTNITLFPGPVFLSQNTTQERDTFGEDSTLLTGAMFYNSSEDRFQFFQAGSWVSLINNGSSMGQVLAWNGSEWAATDPAILEGTIENANLLNGFNGSFYLDYNNFTNTPVIFDGNFSSLSNVPTTLAGYGITDAATSAQGLLADTALQPADIGSFAFTGSVLSTDDSSTISVIPAVVFNSDVTVENNLVVNNKITATTIEVENIITSANGTPELQSDTDILLNAGNTVDIQAETVRSRSKVQIEGRVEFGVKATDNDLFVPSVINEGILSQVSTSDPVESGNYVKTVYSHRLGRYSSGGELLLTFADVLSEDPPNRFLVSKFLFHNSGTDTWVVTPMGDSGNQALLSSVSINRVEQGIDTFLTVTVRIPTGSITSASMLVTGQITFTSNPLIVTVSGF